MGIKIKITRFRDNDNVIAKKISRDGNKLQKKAKAAVCNGCVESFECASLEEFKDGLNSLKQDEALVLGGFKHGPFGEIVTEAAEDINNGKYSKTLKHFGWNQGYQLVCIDHDSDLTYEEVIAIINEVLPGFVDVKKVVKYSSSAWIYNENGELLSPSNGFHIYFMVNHPEKIAEIFQGAKAVLHRKLWIKGHGHIKNSKPKDRRETAVRQYERTIYDNCVFSPERIFFEAAPILEAGLRKDKQEAFIIDGPAEYLDLKSYEPLSEQDDKEYSRIVDEAKKLNENDPYVVDSRKLFMDHVVESYKTGKYKKKPEYNGLDSEEIFNRQYKLSQGCFLTPDHVVELASGDSVTVGTILADPEKYHGVRCKDPHEPDYGNPDIAIIYSNQQVPVIFSHAHGGIPYRLILIQGNKPDFCSKEYCLDHFYMVAHSKKNEICYIDGYRIEIFCHAGFINAFAGVYVDIGDDEHPKKMLMTTWWMKNANKKQIKGDGFDPSKPMLYEKYGDLLLNEYVPEILRYGFDTPSREEYEEYAKLWLDHIRNLIHDPIEAEIVIDWFAYLLQHPSERPMFALLITSAIRGVGKDMITDIWSVMLGLKYVKKPSMKDLTKGEWGDAYYRSKLIVVSECGSYDDRYTVGNTIKGAITTPSMQMNLKGKRIANENIYAGIVFFSNSQSPFRLDEGDRRFFVTRCDWTKEETNEKKDNGYYVTLWNYYREPEHLHGLYHYLLNRVIMTNMKGDAPMTSSKRIMMESEPNDVEQFFIDLKNHPCKYWTKEMTVNLFVKEYGELTASNEKSFNYFFGKMVKAGPQDEDTTIKIQDKSYRLKTFSIENADVDNASIRKNCVDNWGITTTSLHPVIESSDGSLDLGDLNVPVDEDEVANALFFPDSTNGIGLTQ